MDAVIEEAIFKRASAADPALHQQLLIQLAKLFRDYESHLARHQHEFLSGPKMTFIDVMVFNEIDQVLTLFEDFQMPVGCS